jgi:hypothetical protein
MKILRVCLVLSMGFLLGAFAVGMHMLVIVRKRMSGSGLPPRCERRRPLWIVGQCPVYPTRMGHKRWMKSATFQNGTAGQRGEIPVFLLPFRLDPIPGAALSWASRR